MPWVEGVIHACEPGVSDQSGPERSGYRVELRRCAEYLCLVAGFIIGWLWNKCAASIQELHHIRHMEDMLVEADEVEQFLFADGSAQRESELVLHIWILFPHECI